MIGPAWQDEADRDETSVVIGLRELRRIEEDRVRDEREAVRRAEAARAEAIAEAARRVREEEEARARAIAAAEAQRLDDERRQAREAELRVREAEARARVVAAVELESARLASDAELRRQEVARRRPAGLVAAAAALAVATAVLTWQLVERSDQAARAERRWADAAQRVAALEAEVRAGAERRGELERALDAARHPAPVIPAAPAVAAPRRDAPRGGARPQPRPAPSTSPTVEVGCVDTPLGCLTAK